MSPAILEVGDLWVEFTTPEGPVHAVNGVSFTLDRGETLAILGESGCGKSVTLQAVMGLVRSPPGRVRARHLRFDGIDLLRAPPGQLRTIRGPRIGMIFQDPFMSLDPAKTVGQQIGEMFRVHRGLSRAEARRKSLELMERVRIPSAHRRIDDYPHQFSGGMSQRVMIASAIALDPDLLIADEPTTALDVTVQAQIMDILAELRRETGMAMVLITHDLRLATEVAERAAIMYAGRLVETGPMTRVYRDPKHPYTIGLLRSLPDLQNPHRRLRPISGTPPVLARLPVACDFAPRCAWRAERCTVELPELREIVRTAHRRTADRRAADRPSRYCACHFAERISDG